MTLLHVQDLSSLNQSLEDALISGQGEEEMLAEPWSKDTVFLVEVQRIGFVLRGNSRAPCVHKWLQV